MAVSGNEDEVPLTGSEKRKKLPFKFNFGSVLNYAIAIFQFAAFLACVVVIGTVGGVQSNLRDYSDPQLDGNNVSLTRHACYMLSKCDGEPVDNSSQCYFKPNKNTAVCDGTLVGYAVIGLGALVFFVLSITKGVLNLKLNWTLLIELTVMVFLFVLEFCLSVTISIGNLKTCNSIKKFYDSKDCRQPFPYVEFNYNSRATIAEESSWFVLLFLFIPLVFYVISLILFLRQKKKEKNQKNDLFIDSGKNVPGLM